MPRKRQTIARWAQIVAGTAETTLEVSRAVAAGELRPIGANLYTPNLDDDLDVVVRRHWYPIVGHLVPGAVISFRTALDAKPAPDGSVFVVGKTKYERDLPGLLIRGVKGAGPQPGDMAFPGGVSLAGRARALLEALKPSRRRNTVARGMTRPEIEAILEREFQSGGEPRLNQIRDEAASLSRILDAEREYVALAGVIGMILGSRPGTPTQATVIGRLAADPYDAERIAVFETLLACLHSEVAPSRPAQTGANAFTQVSFFDAYFSNYIEGTEFEVDEARAIIFEHAIPTARPEDAHDILGTYAVVGSKVLMSQSIRDDKAPNDFLERVRYWHGRILEGRPDKRPRHWKKVVNRAGATRFVAPGLALGTLRRGFEMFRTLDHSFQRAVAVMFLLSEVHPFDDGNGRLSRAFMNAELVADGQSRILIPTVYREEYLTGLRLLTRTGEPQVYTQVMQYAQRYVAAIDWSTYEQAYEQLTRTHAFDKPRLDIRLRIPADDIRRGKEIGDRPAAPR